MVYRIDVPTASNTPPPVGNVGQEGYPTAGNPGITPPTTIDPYWAYSLCEEIRNVVVAAGLTPTKGNVAQLLQAIQSLPGKNYENFVTSGNFTVPANVYRCKVTAIAGGGGGGGTAGSGGGGAGGGAGGTCINYFGVVPGEIVAVTVGAGGAGGAAVNQSGGNGGNGGNSSFGTAMTAYGGLGGAGANNTTNSPGGVGGGGNGGDPFWPGGCGTDGQYFSGGSNGFGGNGGGSFAGGGARGSAGDVTPSNALTNGAGGGGAYGSVAQVGGSGAPGIVIIEY